MSSWQDRYFFASAVELNGALRAGAFTATQMIRAFSRRWESEGARSGLLQLPLFDQAHGAARDVDKELKRGRTRGVLQGVPFAVSDLLSTAARPTTWGAGALAGQVFPEDAAAVERLRRARAIPVAKLRTDPLGGAAAGLESFDNAAAAVQSGLAPFVLSVDFSGNLLRGAARAACCALRPTFGRVSAFGAAPLSWTLATVAIAARSVDDCGYVLEAISGADSRAPQTPGHSFHYSPQFARPPQQLRVSLAGPGVPAVAGVLARLGAAATAPGALPFPCREILGVILAVEAASALEDLLPAAPHGADFLEAARQIKALDYVQAMRLRSLVQGWFAERFSATDVFVLSIDQAGFGPTSTPAPDAPGSAQGLVPATLLAGLPMLVLPPAASNGMPGLLLFGRAGSENELLKLAAALAA